MRIPPALPSVLLALSLLSSCAFGPADPASYSSRRKTSLAHFGSPCFAVVYSDFRTKAAENRFEEAWQEIDAMLAEVEAAVGADKAGSDIRAFNKAKAGSKIAVRPLTAEIARKAVETHRLTGGAFNPAVANLVDLWGFSPRFRRAPGRGGGKPYDRMPDADGSLPLPDRRYVEAFRRLSDFSRVSLTESAGDGFFLEKRGPDEVIDGAAYSVRLDFGGIAKGWAADKAAEILERRGYRYGYVSLGLSSLRLLKRPVSDDPARGKNLWAVRVEGPEEAGGGKLSVFARDAGVSTSGTYEQCYRLGGRTYSHIIDPKTGEPTQTDLVSATVVGPDAGRADALSTALLTMGSERARAFIREKLSDYRVVCLALRGGARELITNVAPEELRTEELR